MKQTMPSVLVLEPGATDRDLGDVAAVVDDPLREVTLTRGDSWVALALGEGLRPDDDARFERLPFVHRVVHTSAPYPLASRELFNEDVGIHIPGRRGADVDAAATQVGGRAPLGVIVGSRWAASSGARFELLAPLLREAGCSVFHAGPMVGTSDLGASTRPDGNSLSRLRDVAHDHELSLCVEVSDAGQIDAALESVDLLQVGSRNMQDFSLLRELGRIDRPVLLRRGLGATVEEFLLAAEYVLLHGNGRVILCESGIRTFDALDKPRFEINAIPLIKQLSHLPLVADPTQSALHSRVVPAMAKAAVAAGADGLVLEVGTEAIHDPEGAAIDIETMRALMTELRPIARAVGRSFGPLATDDRVMPQDAAGVLRLTERTLAQTIESITDRSPHLEVVKQWRLTPPVDWLSPPLSREGDILARCTSYRMGSVRLSRNLSYVDLARIDPTLGALLETKQLNLGQLFVDPRIEKLNFEFGTQETAGEMDEVFRICFPNEREDLGSYVWRRYQAAIGGVVTFLVVEALPVPVWDRLLDTGSGSLMREGTA